MLRSRRQTCTVNIIFGVLVLLWEVLGNRFLLAFYILIFWIPWTRELDRAVIPYIHCNSQRLPNFSFVHEHTFVNTFFFLDLVVG
jgi:hypothetical protein